MKRTISYLALILTILTFWTACGKDEPGEKISGSEYYFRFKQDGVLKEYSRNGTLIFIDSAYLPVTSSNGYYSFTTGITDRASAFTVHINDFTGTPIVAGKTYKTVVNSGLTTVQAYLALSENFTSLYTSAITNADPPYESAEITLTEITDNFVKGIFQGKLLVDETTSATVKYKITEGEFYLPRSKRPREETIPEGDGFIQGIINGKKFEIREAADGLNIVSAGFYTDNSSGETTYRFSVSGTSNILLPSYNTLSISFVLPTPFSGGTVTALSDGDPMTFEGYPLFFASAQYKSGSGLVNYTGLLDPSLEGMATITFTKFTTTKGEYIEGTFSTTTGFLTTGSSNSYPLSEGRFRAKVE